MNADDPAFPTYLASDRERGLTKREYFAAQFLGPLVATFEGYDQRDEFSDAARAAVEMADALIVELSKSK